MNTITVAQLFAWLLAGGLAVVLEHLPFGLWDKFPKDSKLLIVAFLNLVLPTLVGAVPTDIASMTLIGVVGTAISVVVHICEQWLSAHATYAKQLVKSVSPKS